MPVAMGEPSTFPRTKLLGLAVVGALLITGGLGIVVVRVLGPLPPITVEDVRVAYIDFTPPCYVSVSFGLRNRSPESRWEVQYEVAITSAYGSSSVKREGLGIGVRAAIRRTCR